MTPWKKSSNDIEKIPTHRLYSQHFAEDLCLESTIARSGKNHWCKSNAAPLDRTAFPRQSSTLRPIG